MPETVLLVEDDPSLRRLVERLLAKFGYTVIVATGAEGAIARFTNSDIGVDLLITDVNMPGMRGPELAQRLLASRPGLKVLYVSGYADKALEAGKTEIIEDNARKFLDCVTKARAHSSNCRKVCA